MFLVRETGPGGADGTPGRGDRRPPAGKPPGKPATGLLLTEPLRGLADLGALTLAAPGLLAAPRGDGHGGQDPRPGAEVRAHRGAVHVGLLPLGRRGGLAGVHRAGDPGPPERRGQVQPPRLRRGPGDALADRRPVGRPRGSADPVPPAARPPAPLPAMSAAPATGPVPATKPAPWAFAAPWQASGFVTDLDGPVHWIEFEGSGEPLGDTPSGLRPSGDATPIVFVHGLGGSHLNWCQIGPALAAGRRAVALDLHGFGLTPGTKADSTVQRNTKLLDQFLRQVVGAPVILAGNSMGGLISILQTSAAPELVRGLVLVDPALPVPLRTPDKQVGSQFLIYSLPGVGELYLRRVLSRRSPQVP